MELGKEVILLGEVEWHDLGLLVVDLQLVGVSEVEEVSQLVLQDRLIRWERQPRSLMKIGRANDGW